MKILVGFVLGVTTVFASIRALHALMELDERWEYAHDDVALADYTGIRGVS